MECLIEIQLLVYILRLGHRRCASNLHVPLCDLDATTLAPRSKQNNWIRFEYSNQEVQLASSCGVVADKELGFCELFNGAVSVLNLILSTKQVHNRAFAPITTVRLLHFDSEACAPMCTRFAPTADPPVSAYVASSTLPAPTAPPPVFAYAASSTLPAPTADPPVSAYAASSTLLAELILRRRPCLHTLPPPHSLQILRCRSCLHTLPPPAPHSLH